MKPFFTPFLLVLLATSTFAQNQPRDPRRVVPAPTTNRGGVDVATTPGSEAITENVTLKWKGSFQGMVDLDFEMTGVGPRFVSDFAGRKVNPDDPLPAPIFTINATLSKSDHGYSVAYSVGARVAFPTSTFSRPGGGVSTNIEYRDLLVTGTALVSPGKPLAISKLNDKVLTLEIVEAK